MEAVQLRQEVDETRRKLGRLDAETTRLVARLKASRESFVDQVREHTRTEERIASYVKANAAQLPPDALKKEEEMKREAGRLALELSEAKTEAGKWFSVARRQEEMLQQEREAANGDESSVLAKHPSGEVFLLPYPPEDGSEDGYYGGPPRRGGRGQDVALASSDEEEQPRRTPLPPPPPGQRWRALGREGDDSSNADSASPSGSSGPPSSGPSPSGDAGSRVAASLARANAAEAAGCGGDSSDDERGGGALAGAGASRRAVPPLPQLRGQPRGGADSAEEVSSEDGPPSAKSV